MTESIDVKQFIDGLVAQTEGPQQNGQRNMLLHIHNNKKESRPELS